MYALSYAHQNLFEFQRMYRQLVLILQVSEAEILFLEPPLPHFHGKMHISIYFYFILFLIKDKITSNTLNALLL